MTDQPTVCGHGDRKARLEDYGWDEAWAVDFARSAVPGSCPARVIVEHQSIYRVISEHGELLARLSGRLRHDAVTRDEIPAVGDWVVIKARAAEERATIQAILPRRSKFVRKAAGQRTEEQIVGANVDVVFLFTSLNADFNLRRLERYLAAASESGSRPVVILSKTDLCPDVADKIAAAESIAGGVPVHAISSVDGGGIAELRQYFAPGVTVAMLGSSGVGKSTLINRIAGTNLQKVAEIRAQDDRGRHTTTRRELILLPDGGLVLDTPGMRELQLWGGEEGVTGTFDDVESLAANCRFSNCTHQTEPGCAVKRALETGELDAGRFASYEKLQKEVEFLELRTTVNAKVAEKQRWKKAIEKMRKKENRR